MTISAELEIVMRSERMEFWQRHVEGWRASGLSGRAYCEREGVSLGRFYKWRRRLGQESGALVPVELVPSLGAVRILVGEAEIVVDADSSPTAVRIALEGLRL